MRIANQGNNRRRNTATRSNGCASTSVRGTGEMKQSVMDGIHRVIVPPATHYLPGDRFRLACSQYTKGDIHRSEAERQQLVLQNCCTRTGQATVPVVGMHESTLGSSTLHPTVTRAARSSTGHRTADQDYILNAAKQAHIWMQCLR
jgi:hypothetical protein